MWFQRCPSTEQLEEFVAGQTQSSEIATHVSNCDSCRDAVKIIQAENNLIAQLRATTQTELDETRRNQIVDICCSAVRTAAPNHPHQGPAPGP